MLRVAGDRSPVALRSACGDQHAFSGTQGGVFVPFAVWQLRLEPHQLKAFDPAADHAELNFHAPIIVAAGNERQMRTRYVLSASGLGAYFQ
jgi:hypothetical protein